ncbi:hypothetical protein TURU_123877 [Turdus rufiventris]|nr:hypothetical protein TURU_123877 [Turdus rufiventris]
MSFGKIQEDVYQEDLRFSPGLLGKAYSGHVCQTKPRRHQGPNQQNSAEAVSPMDANPLFGSMALSTTFTPL